MFFLRLENAARTAIVARYGIMSSSWGGIVNVDEPMVKFWHLKERPFNAPKAHDAAIAFKGCQPQNITRATAIHPAPAVMFSCQRGTKTNER